MGDPIQVSVTLLDVTDKTNPTYVDSWYDADHPSGPHNLYPHMIDGEWYILSPTQITKNVFLRLVKRAVASP